MCVGTSRQRPWGCGSRAKQASRATNKNGVFFSRNGSSNPVVISERYTTDHLWARNGGVVGSVGRSAVRDSEPLRPVPLSTNPLHTSGASPRPPPPPIGHRHLAAHQSFVMATATEGTETAPRQTARPPPVVQAQPDFTPPKVYDAIASIMAAKARRDLVSGCPQPPRANAPRHAATRR